MNIGQMFFGFLFNRIHERQQAVLFPFEQHAVGLGPTGVQFPIRLPERGHGLDDLSVSVVVIHGRLHLAHALADPIKPRSDAGIRFALRQQGLEQLLPFNPRKVNYESVHEAAVIIKGSNGKVLLRHCGDDERWAGMWDYPRFSLDMASSPDRIQEQLEKGVQTLTNVQIGRAEPLVMLEHSVTRFRITLHCYRTSVTPSSHQSESRQDLCWLSPEELKSYPLSSMGRTISEQLL